MGRARGPLQAAERLDVSYHGVVYTEAFGPAAYIGRARVVPLRNMGAAISPFNAFQILQGIETLALRVERISDNALKIAQHLARHENVEWVNYAGLPDHPDHPLVARYLSGRAPGILTFGVKGGRDGGAKFQDALKLFTRLVNIGDTKSLATHPASTTHRQLSPAELAKAGVKEETVRLSIGIEHIDDLLADLDQALAQLDGNGRAGLPVRPASNVLTLKRLQGVQSRLMPGRCPACTNHPYPAAGWPDDGPLRYANRPRGLMTPTAKLALLTLPPLLAACFGALAAAWRAPGPKTSSVIQHFTGGIVFAAAALELLPQDRAHALFPVVVGFVLGIALMLAIRALSGAIETRFEQARLPVSLIIVTAIDLVIDGLVLGIAFSASDESGIILTVALTLEVLFLALSVSAALAAAGIGRLLSIVVPVEPRRC